MAAGSATDVVSRGAEYRVNWVAVCGRLFGSLCVAAIVAIGMSSSAQAAQSPYPKADGFVVDAADAIDEADEIVLEESLQIFEDSTGNELAVLVVSTLDGQTAEDYATGVFAEWGVGDRDGNNGVLLLVALTERAVRIEVGDGLRDHVDVDELRQIVAGAVQTSLDSGDVASAVELGVITAQEELEAGPAGEVTAEDDPVLDPYGEPVAGDDPVRDLESDDGLAIATGFVVVLLVVGVVGTVLVKAVSWVRSRRTGAGADW